MEKIISEEKRLYIMQMECKYKNVVSKHLKKRDVVFTDVWLDKTVMHPFVKLSTVKFTVGCYTVRMTERGRCFLWYLRFCQINFSNIRNL